MKRNLLFLLVLVVSITTCAQTQKGYVKTKGRLASDGTIIKGTRLSGAMITVKGRNSVLSGNNGAFTLAIPGSNYYLQNVQKQGYVITDPDILTRHYAYSKNPLVLVLETQEQQTDDKLLIEGRMRRNLTRQLQQREEEIESLKEENKITKQEYQQQLQRLFKEEEDNRRLIGEMVERYAKMDYDQLDEFNRLIATYILNGELDKADSLLNTKGDISMRSASLKQLQKRNAEEEAELTKRKKSLEESKLLANKLLMNTAQACYSKFEIFKLKHQNDSAAYYISLRSSLDTLNTEWLIDVANFTFYYLADYDKALELFKKALRTCVNKNGGESLDAIILYNNMGMTCNEQGKYNQAEEYFLKAFELSKTLFGQDHPVMAVCLNNIGHVYMDCGKNDEAQRLFEQSLAVKTNVAGDSIRCFLNLGALNLYKGNYALSKSYYDKALTLIQKEEQSDIIKESTCYNGMAVLLSRTNNYSESITYYKKALELNLKAFGEDHPDIAVSYNNIATTFNNFGQYNKALEYLNKSLAINLKILGSWHPTIAYNYTNIGYALNNLGEHDKAMEYYQKALAIDLDFYGENHRRVSTDLVNIGSIYQSKGDYSTSTEYNLRALKILEELYGGKHPNVAVCYNNIGMNYECLKDYPKAVTYLEKALEVDIAIGGEDQKTVALAYNNLGSVYNNMGDYEKAAMYLEKAFPILVHALGEEHPKVAISYYNASVLHKKQQNYQKSLELAEKAYSIILKVLPENHTTVQIIKKGIEEVKSKMK